VKVLSAPGNNRPKFTGRDMRSIRIAIIEPSEITALGFQELFVRHAPEFEILGIYRDLLSFRAFAPSAIDIILMNADVVSFIEQINIRELYPKHPDTVLVTIGTKLFRANALSSFDGFLHLYDKGASIIKQLHAIIDQTLVAKEPDVYDGPPISVTERNLIIDISKGLRNKEIANHLHLSVNSVATYRKRLQSKLNVSGAAGFTLYAVTHHMIDEEEALMV
jgi:DNA-binding NarL/FixJ family response regulator